MVMAISPWARCDVHVFLGSSGGLTAAGDRRISPATSGVPGRPTPAFARSIATADFNGDGLSDVAAEAPQDSVHAPLDDTAWIDSGLVKAIYGTATGITVERNQTWDYDVPGVPRAPKPFSDMGLAVTFADLGRGRWDDLVFAAPSDGVSGHRGAVLRPGVRRQGGPVSLWGPAVARGRAGRYGFVRGWGCVRLRSRSNRRP
jgi:FG-GAP repeat